MINSILLKNNIYLSCELYDLIRLITKKYKIEISSYGLIEEIICTIKNIANTMTQDSFNLINIFLQGEINEDMANISTYLKTLNSIVCIFHQMNYQDFPEFFEDNLQDWMKIILAFINLNVPNNYLNDRTISRLYLKLKTKSLRALNLYCNSYYDDFKEYHDSFIQPVWNMLVMTKTDEIFYKLTKELLDYFKILFNCNRIPLNFNIPQITKHITENLIIPNMRLTMKDLDEFEENPISFLKVEFEEVDMDSSNIK
jgi:exportin-2 (importin alpha re-exporter)